MKKRMLAGAAGLAAIALVGGTFAYFTQNTVIDNPFNTSNYKTTVVEEFNPEEGEKWQPGAEVAKKVTATNTGDQPVVVRVSFNDIWSRDGAEIKNVGTTDSMEVWQDGGEAGPTDGWISRDKSVVHKYFAEDAKPGGGKWSDLQSDGYYYYLTPLAPKGEAGSSTGTFLSSVRLADDIDLGKYSTNFYYAIDKKGAELSDDFTSADSPWTLVQTMDGRNDNKVTAYSVASLKEFFAKDDAKMNALMEKLENGELAEGKTIFTAADVVMDEAAKGYSDADYVLEITVETVQATDKAVMSAFFGDQFADDDLKAIYDGWNLTKEDLETETTAEAAGSTEASSGEGA